MERNDGNIYYDFYNKNLKEKQRIAKLFSEDNIYLEKLLLNLWSFNIKTQSCCIGHTEEAYITIFYEDNNLDYLNKIINFVNISQIKDLEISINSFNDKNTFTIYIPLEYRDFVFQKMNQLITFKQEKKWVFLNSLLEIRNLALNNGYFFELKIINDEIKIVIYTKQKKDIENASFMNLDNLINFFTYKNNDLLPIICVINKFEYLNLIDEKIVKRKTK